MLLQRVLSVCRDDTVQHQCHQKSNSKEPLLEHLQSRHVTLEELCAVLLLPGVYQISFVIIPPLTGQPYSIGDLKKIAGYVMQGE